MNTRIFLAAFAAISFLFTTPAMAQSPDNRADSTWIRTMATELLANAKAYENLRVLTKEIGARLAGSPGMVKAEKWGFNLMKQTGPDSAWLQQCMVPHWVRGGKDRVVASVIGASPGTASTRSLNAIALGNSNGSGPKGVQAPVIEVKSFAQLDSIRDQVKGKIVFYNYHFRTDLIRTFESYGDAVKYRGGGASAAAKYGAVGVLVRSMTHSTDNNPHTGAMHYDSAYAMIPALALGLQDADWLSTELRSRKVSATLTSFGHFLPDTIGHNVIGELRGTEFPNEIITIGGHLDSWDNVEGAHDDGSGVVHTIEVLRTLKAMNYRPKHTIRFVLFANEENGTRGGNKYAELAVANGEKHLLAIESDDGGFTPRSFGFTGTPEQLVKMKSWESLLKPYGIAEIDAGGGGTDIGPLREALHTPLVGFEPDSQRYFDIHHAAGDVFEAVNKRELLLGALNITALIYLVDQHGL